MSLDNRVFARHPHAYDWHDGHTDHHVLLVKADVGQHPHVDGAIPSQSLQNEQAAGKGVATYRQYAQHYGTIKPGVGTDLKHYNYEGKNSQVNQLLNRHGFQAYYAGGKYGKPDLANRNYNTKHLMVYDPTPESGGDFGDQDYTDSWRKVHELAHALTYPELNRIYGEGRRIGKLGTHRTEREALRAVHWEHLVAHKQRELNRQLGIEVPDHVFNKEYNTVMHDAAHRAVTGKFTEPSQEGFDPHPYKIPLETSLGLVSSAARNMGLRNRHDLLKKSDNSAHNLPSMGLKKKSQGDRIVADDKKLSVPEALRYIYPELKKRIEEFADRALELRKAESVSLSKNAVMGSPDSPGAAPAMSMNESCNYKKAECPLCKEAVEDKDKHLESAHSEKMAQRRKNPKDSVAYGKAEPNTAYDHRNAPGVTPSDKKSKVVDNGTKDGDVTKGKALGKADPPMAKPPKPATLPNAKPKKPPKKPPKLPVVNASKTTTIAVTSGPMTKAAIPTSPAAKAKGGLVGQSLPAAGMPIGGAPMGATPKPAKVQTMVERVASRVPKDPVKLPGHHLAFGADKKSGV